ncbi:MAG: hypothetical protein H5T97_05785, partial [Firmicutes bacterium]|nr:hypothetical protein [Bacillota bacterium]
IVAGFGAGVLLALGGTSFLRTLPEADPVLLLACLSTVLLSGLIGVVDNLAGLRQGVKALLPILAALPLAVVRAGHTEMHIPLIGRVEFGLLYPLLLIPAGVTGAANAVNMLAGFNGLEAGMGLVAAGSLAVVAWSLGEVTALVILLAAVGPWPGCWCTTGTRLKSSWATWAPSPSGLSWQWRPSWATSRPRGRW